MRYWVDTNIIRDFDSVVDFEELKPFPTCQTCDRWITKKCVISRLCEDLLRNTNRDISKGIYPDHDFCCILHPDFAGAEETKGSDK